MKKTICIAFLILNSSFLIFAEEGMWIPSLLKALNETDMQKLGCKLSADEIYNINKSSLKDGVLQFAGGCTGEMISAEGLFITNHHCGYGQIQAHSSVDHDYLTNGFWAMNKKDELTCPGITVTFIVRIEDVTSKILDGIDNSISETKRDSIIMARGKKIEKESTDGTHYNARVKSFFYGNEFYLFVMETFKDVRMVGAPPESIGKFGGDTDNWMWPRHTGDFSLFRVYADKDNNPADYSPDNVPFKQRYFFPISLKGVQENDFTMVFGFPGRTTEYLPSEAVELIQKVSDPIKVKARTARLAVWEEDMKKSTEVRIKYASKYAGVSNYHKKWAGEIRGLERADGIKVKQEIEKTFMERVSKNPEWSKKYGTILSDFETAYKKLTPYQKVLDYYSETINAIEIIKFANSYRSLIDTKPEELAKKLEAMKAGEKAFFKDYNSGTDKKLFVAMLKIYYENVDKSMHPDFFKTIESKYKGDYEKYAEKIFKKSIFSSEGKVSSLLNGYSADKAKVIKNDPAYILAQSAFGFYGSIGPQYSVLTNEISRLQRDYMYALKVVIPEKKYYPDANSTLRLSYGKVDGYEGRDAVEFNYYTTLDGVIEKEDSTSSEFKVPKKLHDLYEKKEYGQYADKDGKVHVAFIASQHITGGNSGSPVLDASGNLVGVAFDSNWEGVQSDIMYDGSQVRAIILDIRYALFVIDKFAGDTQLVKEMKLVQ
ncbi:MAG: S46 family peptidase [Bacteroidetes bacterium]|nr:S46 family peptidase [Bacteroidota bacterium]